MLLPGIRSRTVTQEEPFPGESPLKPSDRTPTADKTPRTLKREMCIDLMDLIEENGMELMATGACDERSGPGWEAAVVLGDQENLDDFTMWIGDVDDALNFEELRKRRITAVVNMALGDCRREKDFRLELIKKCPEDVAPEDHSWESMEFSAELYKRYLGNEDFKYLAIDAEDTVGYPISEHFDELVSFFHDCREARRSVFVHCMMGRNRAACACAVFLMREGIRPQAEGLGLRETVDWLSKRRVGVLRNDGFLEQLALHGYLGREAEGYVEDLIDKDFGNC